MGESRGQVRRGAAATPAVRSPVDGGSTVSFNDTIRLPDLPVGAPVETVVRPALSVLYRVAVGRGADYFAPRFVAYEGTAGVRAGWHWPALLLPAAWAFYRRLWLLGAVLSLLPIVGALLLRLYDSGLPDSPVAWLAVVLVVVWLVPGVVGAALATPMLYRRLRDLVRQVEASTPTVASAASALAKLQPTAPAAAVLFGGGAIVIALCAIGPDLAAAYAERGIRAQIAAGLAAVQPLQRQVEDDWLRLGRVLGRANVAAPVANVLGAVDVNPATGRLRLDLGTAVPEVAGRAILLAPAVDPAQRIEWMCVPVGIPARYLPRECRRGSPP
jgi:hypothetical protein